MNIKLKSITSVFILLTLFACGGDKENDSVESIDYKAKILGSWIFIESSTNGIVDDNSGNCKLFNTLFFEPFQANQRKAFNGLCLVIVKSKIDEAGEITIKATSKGLKETNIRINTK